MPTFRTGARMVADEVVNSTAGRNPKTRIASFTTPHAWPWREALEGEIIPRGQRRNNGLSCRS
jgi:hypothetical protein